MKLSDKQTIHDMALKDVQKHKRQDKAMLRMRAQLLYRGILHFLPEQRSAKQYFAEELSDA